MQITPIPASKVEAEWEWLGPLLETAIAVRNATTLEVVQGKLIAGETEAAKVTLPDASGVVVSELCIDDGAKCLWLSYIAGDSKCGPKAFVKMMRSIMAEYEELGRSAGADEVRIGGRDWSRVFPDYERFDDVPNRLRKIL